jgi:hypothetical protein
VLPLPKQLSSSSPYSDVWENKPHAEASETTNSGKVALGHGAGTLNPEKMTVALSVVRSFELSVCKTLSIMTTLTSIIGVRMLLRRVRDA